MVTNALFIFGIACLLDLTLGDPPRWPHPIRWMGRSIEILEPVSRRWPMPLFFSGAVMTLLLVAMAYGLTFGLVALAYKINPTLEITLNIILIYYCISIRSLERSALAVLAALRRDKLGEGRYRVGRIVGRDTDRLTAAGVRRATIETVAENFVDGVAAPLFFAAIGGAPLAMAYKMVNTLDSMIGYKNERYRQFGKTAARLDDAANFLPARLTVPVIAMASQLLGGSGRRTWNTAIVEGNHHTSPNAGYPEAAFAGALGVRLNGPGYYGGVCVDKPFIGIPFGATVNEDIQRACDLMLLASILWLAMIVPLYIIIRELI